MRAKIYLYVYNRRSVHRDPKGGLLLFYFYFVTPRTDSGMVESWKRWPGRLLYF